jgi:ATP-dependent Lhr-like helicase
VVQVEAIEETGRSRWLGQSRGLSAALARSIRSVLAEGEIGVRLTRRAQGEWAAARGDFDFVRDGRTALVDDGDGRRRWWTFVGGMGNAVLERALEADGTTVVSRDSLALSLAGRVSPGDLQAVARGVNHESAVNAAREAVDERAVEQLKFSACLPPRLAAHTLALRAVDTKSARSCGEEPCDISVGSAT